MAKLTGQFTTPSFDASNNKTHKAFLHGVVFVFTGVTKVTRESDDKGKYDFDLANGEYEVSVYLKGSAEKGSAEKDRFDMRVGEKFTVTASTPTDALEKWLQVIGDNGKDEVATYYENLLTQMQKVANDFKDETQSIGTGKYLRETSSKSDFLKNAGAYSSTAIPPLKRGDSGVALGRHIESNSPGLNCTEIGLNSTFLYYEIQGVFSTEEEVAIFRDMRGTRRFYATKRSSTANWSKLTEDLNSGNTTVDSNGFIKAASPVLRLFNDRIETNDQFTEEPVFEKIEPGTYKISNTLGLAQEGWTYEKPRGSDGQPYFRIVVDKLDDGCIVTVHDEYDDYERVEIMDIDGNKRTVTKQTKVLSAPRDIKDHERWIDLRFHEEPQGLEDEELLSQLDNLDESAH